MRQAIDGTGADSTLALKAYLLENDEVLANELYELVFPLSLPSIVASSSGGGALGPFSLPVALGPGESALGLLTTAGAKTEDNLSMGSIPSVGASFGEIERWHSSPIVTQDGPGYIIFSALDTLPISQSLINKIYAAAIVDFGGELGFQFIYCNYPGHTQTVTDSVYPVSGQVASRIAIGSEHTIDLSAITFQFINKSNTSSTLTPPGNVMRVLAIGIIVYYGGGGSSSGSGLVTRKMYFCDASSPLTYRGQQYAPAVIKNNGFKSKIGADVDSLQLEWKFRDNDVAMITDPGDGHTILTMLQAFKEGLWDGAWVRWKRAYMPTFGDCDTLGAVRMFRGQLAPVEVDRLTAKLTVNSITELFNRKIPAQLIEQNNRALQIGPGLPPDLNPDPSHWTYFECVAGEGGTTQKIVASQTAPAAGVVYAPGTFDLGFLWFQASPFQYFVAQIQHYEVIAGYNVFYLFKPLYVDPHLYGSNFAAFIPIPKDSDVASVSGLELHGFPHVPLPEQAV